MALRMFDDGTGWDAARKELRWTASALRAEGQAKLDEACRKHLAQWVERDTERRDAEDAEVDANALVATRDARLDRAYRSFEEQCGHDFGRDSAEYRALFPEPPNEVIALGLESELVRLGPLLGAAREKQKALSADAKKKLAAVQKAMNEGKAALTAREEATLGLGRVRLRLQTWREDANALRRSVHNQLETHALAQKLPRDYADGFFPPSPRVRKKKDKPAPEAPPAAK